jgi:glycosyltransferase involved in cell wall biosynthesis
MQNSRLKVSIVIPVYNEQDHIGACLEAISKQIVKPFEVIVVNNKSTDKTADVVKQFPFVTLINESRQGVVHARDCGFNQAKGDIIGRIDADTILPEDWTSKVEAIFKDKTVKAVSGSLHFYDIGWSQIIDGIDAYWRAWMANRMEPNSRVFLLGSNMAIRRSAWEVVRSSVCRQKGLHEDLDLALHLSEAKQRVVFDPDLQVSLSARRIDTNILNFLIYCSMSPLTYAKHNAKEHRYMYPLIAIAILNYVLLRLLFRAFDHHAQKFSLKLIFSHGMARVNPATYV